MNVVDFEVVEGTTHYINIDCIDENTKERFYLDGYEVVFWLGNENNAHVIKKDISVADNTVTVKLKPEETIGKNLTYECRIFASNGDIFHVITGRIKILKPKIPVELLSKE